MPLLIAVDIGGCDVSRLIVPSLAPSPNVLGCTTAMFCFAFGEAVDGSKLAEMALPHSAFAVETLPKLVLKRGAEDL
jgi:hypothetical protein